MNVRAQREDPETRAATSGNDHLSRVRGWFRDPAVWAWIGVGLFSLLPLGSALAQLAG